MLSPFPSRFCKKAWCPTHHQNWQCSHRKSNKLDRTLPQTSHKSEVLTIISSLENYAEHSIRFLSVMVRRVIREHSILCSQHNQVQRWCAQFRNFLTSRKLKSRTPHESWHGTTPDILNFRLHTWKPVWHANFEDKRQKCMLHPARFLGIAEDSSNTFTCFIRTESKNTNILAQSYIKYRRVSTGEESECISNNPDYFLFWLHKFIDGP